VLVGGREKHYNAAKNRVEPLVVHDLEHLCRNRPLRAAALSTRFIPRVD
jgi:hypothetical protein